jgi:predicted  nucleic acid-binding Zn-ribbon protein
MSDDKTEVEFAGVKFRGGKIFLLITALSTLGGGLYAAFEFWKDYQDMKAQIQKYVAPDLSGFDKRLEVIKKEMETVRTTVNESTDYTRDIKNDLKNDLRKLEKDMRDFKRQTDEDIKKLSKDVDDKINKALNNPLNVMTK